MNHIQANNATNALNGKIKLDETLARLVSEIEALKTQNIKL